jgi:hypothetical protein
VPSCHDGGVRHAIRTAPATYVYLFTLCVTTGLLQTASTPTAQRLLLAQSTNLDRLEHQPVHVLVASAFWLQHTWELATWAPLFVIVLAPAERWLRTGRWVLTFAIGHVGATLCTAAGLWLAIDWRLVGAELGQEQDVGVSFGFLAVAGAFTFALRGRMRLLYTAAVWIGVAAGLALSDGVATTGHALAVLLGYACGLVYERPPTSGRRGRWPSASRAATPARGSPSNPS